MFLFVFLFHCISIGMAANQKGKERKDSQNQMFLYIMENVRKWQQKEPDCLSP